MRLDARVLLAREVQLEDYTFEFRSQPFTARIAESQFYQDPRDPNLKKLVATRALQPSRSIPRSSSRASRWPSPRTPSTSA